MTYTLSLLDKTPLIEGETAGAALQRTVSLAQAAERLGYHRFWLAEHHDFPGLVSPAPEVFAAYLLARTQRIRIGSGGVLLPHYSPYKVAGTFNLLASLAPGRVDLGIGKAPGGLPLSTKALRVLHDPARAPSFEALLDELDGFLAPPAVTDGPRDKARALPVPPVTPERFLLGASPGQREAGRRARLALRLRRPPQRRSQGDRREPERLMPRPVAPRPSCSRWPPSPPRRPRRR